MDDFCAMSDGRQSEANLDVQLGTTVASEAGSLYRVLGSPYFRHELRRLGPAYQRLDAVANLLGGLAELGEDPVGRVAFGDVFGAGVVDQPLGQRGGQDQLAFGDGDEAVPQPVEPELRTVGLADPTVEMMRVLDMTGGTGRRGEHPFADMSRVVATLGQAVLENGRELPGARTATRWTEGASLRAGLYVPHLGKPNLGRAVVSTPIAGAG